jgi:hypothetical protein
MRKSFARMGEDFFVLVLVVVLVLDLRPGMGHCTAKPHTWQMVDAAKKIALEDEDGLPDVAFALLAVCSVR